MIIKSELFVKKIILSILSVLSFSLIFKNDDFLSKQKSYPRVKEAFQQKDSSLLAKLKNVSLNFSNIHILLVAYKDEKILEVYTKSKSAKKFQKFEEYNICATSGNLGPKNKQGDLQIPEGFYHIDRFNPESSYHLSLGLNYPNKADKLRSKAENLGGDIFIHGSCVTIGCLPMTDDIIKEIYISAIQARANGQIKIPVYVFPYRMDEGNFLKHSKEKPELEDFWRNLKLGYDKFLISTTSLSFNIDVNGKYIFP